MSFITNSYQFAVAGGNLFLDNYPGTAFSHSLAFKLLSSYSGQALRIRRTSDNAETDIGFSGDLVDTAAIESHCTGTIGRVVKIYDQSGNGNDFVQSTGFAQPKIYDGGLLTDNGFPTMILDGNDDYMALTTPVDDAADWSCFKIVTRRADGVNGVFISGDATYDAFRFNSNSTFVHGAEGYYINGANDSMASQEIMTTVYRASTSCTVRSNGNAISMGSFNSDSVTDSIGYLGRRSLLFSDGRFQEAHWYSSNKTSDISGIETFLNDEYSVF